MQKGTVVSLSALPVLPELAGKPGNTIKLHYLRVSGVLKHDLVHSLDLPFSFHFLLSGVYPLKIHILHCPGPHSLMCACDHFRPGKYFQCFHNHSFAFGQNLVDSAEIREIVDWAESMEVVHKPVEFDRPWKMPPV